MSVKGVGCRQEAENLFHYTICLGRSEIETVHEPNRRAQLVPWGPLSCQTTHGYGAVGQS